MDNEGGVTFFHGKILVPQYEKLRAGTLLFFRTFLIRKKFLNKKGVSRFSVGNCLSKIAGKHRGRTFLCFRNVLVSQIFWIIGVSQFCRTFLSQIAKNHRG